MSNLASLADDTTSLLIAPELMGAEGQAPPHSNPSSQPPTHRNSPSAAIDPSLSSIGQTPASQSNQPASGYPHFADSNTRGGASAGVQDNDDASWGDINIDATAAEHWSAGDYNYDPTQGHQHHVSSAVQSLSAPEMDAAVQHGQQGQQQGHQHPHQHPHQHQHQEGQQEQDAGSAEDQDQPKKKRPRVSKPRLSKVDKEDPLDFSQMEFENPDQDPKGGPMFVHPAPGTAQACVRCHRIKRKCDQARPRCAGCSKSDVPCVFELSPATSLFVSNLKADNAGLSSQIASAHERIAHLESLVNNLERNGSSGNQASSAFGLDADTSRFYDRPFDSNEAPSASDAEINDFNALARTILGARTTIDLSSAAINTQLPGYDVASQAVESFFATYELVYPFLNKDELIKDMEGAYARIHGGSFGDENDQLKAKEFVLYMVFALGTYGKEMSGQQEKGTVKAYKDKAMVNLSAVVSNESILSIQALLLLALYNLISPGDSSVTKTLTLALQSAISLGLHRQEPNATGEEAEMRRRVFCSVYNLDRAVAIASSQPLSTNESDIEMSVLASPTEMSIFGIPKYQVTNHINTLHRLRAQIYSTLYSAGAAKNVAEQARQALIADSFSRLVLWQTQIPILVNPDTDYRVGSYLWFTMQYHQTRLLLLRPSPLKPSSAVPALPDIYDAASKSLDLAMSFIRSGQTVNALTASQYLQSAICCLYALSTTDSSNPSLVSDQGFTQEVKYRLGQTQEVLNATLAVDGKINEKAKQVYERLENILVGKYGPVDPAQEGMNALADAIGGNGMRDTFVLPPVGGEVNSGQAWNEMKWLW